MDTNSLRKIQVISIPNFVLLIAASQVKVAFGPESTSLLRSFGNPKSAVIESKHEGAILNNVFSYHVIPLIPLVWWRV